MNEFEIEIFKKAMPEIEIIRAIWIRPNARDNFRKFIMCYKYRDVVLTQHIMSHNDRYPLKELSKVKDYIISDVKALNEEVDKAIFEETSENHILQDVNKEFSELLYEQINNYNLLKCLTIEVYNRRMVEKTVKKIIKKNVQKIKLLEECLKTYVGDVDLAIDRIKKMKTERRKIIID